MLLTSPWTPRLADIIGPKHERLAVALSQDIQEGVVSPGVRLPAHRDLAYRLSISVGTVTKAYSALEKRGLVHSEHGRGMFANKVQHESRDKIDLSINIPPVALRNGMLCATLATLANTMSAEDFGSYSPAIGSMEHRTLVTQWLAKGGIAPSVDCVFLTNGAQHALSIAMSVSSVESCEILTEFVTFSGIVALRNYLGYPAQGLPMDKFGMIPEALEHSIRKVIAKGRKPVVITTPSLQNPTTATMDMDRRNAIVSVCRKYEATIIEDDVYGTLVRTDVPRLVDLAPERTFFVTGFSKILSPGLRIGVLVAPESNARAAELGIQATSLMASPINAIVLEKWMLDGTVDSVAALINTEMAYRCDLARTVFPELQIPESGVSLHVWLPMPTILAERVVRLAAERDIILTPPTTVLIDSEATDSGVRLCLGGPKRSDLFKALNVVRQIVDNISYQDLNGCIVV